jgi:hypothetical protein
MTLHLFYSAFNLVSIYANCWVLKWILIGSFCAFSVLLSFTTGSDKDQLIHISNTKSNERTTIKNLLKQDQQQNLKASGQCKKNEVKITSRFGWKKADVNFLQSLIRKPIFPSTFPLVHADSTGILHQIITRGGHKKSHLEIAMPRRRAPKENIQVPLYIIKDLLR